MQPFVENEILRVLMIAILVAAGVSVLARRQREQVVAVFEVISKILFAVIRMIMWVAPLGAFGGMAYTVAQFGSGALTNLALLMATFWGTCAVFVFVVLGLVARWSGFSIFKFVRLLKDELLIIVGTSSSETVLPRLLVKLQKAGASKQSVGVVLPTGYSFNLDGTCIYLTLGALFITQAAGQSMSIGEQIALCALMVLTSKGAAGITGAGLVTLTASLQAFGGTFFTAESIAVGIALGGRYRPDHERGPRADELHRQRRGDDGHRQAPGRARRRALHGRARRSVAGRSGPVEDEPTSPSSTARPASRAASSARASRSPRSPDREPRARVRPLSAGLTGRLRTHPLPDFIRGRPTAPPDAFLYGVVVDSVNVSVFE